MDGTTRGRLRQRLLPAVVPLGDSGSGGRDAADLIVVLCDNLTDSVIIDMNPVSE